MTLFWHLHVRYHFMSLYCFWLCKKIDEYSTNLTDIDKWDQWTSLPPKTFLYLWDASKNVPLMLKKWACYYLNSTWQNGLKRLTMKFCHGLFFHVVFISSPLFIYSICFSTFCNHNNLNECLLLSEMFRNLPYPKLEFNG